MYICGLCKKTQKPRTPATTVVVSTRDKAYPPRPEANDPGGFGHEIAKEIKLCPTCVERNL